MLRMGLLWQEPGTVRMDVAPKSEGRGTKGKEDRAGEATGQSIMSAPVRLDQKYVYV